MIRLLTGRQRFVDLLALAAVGGAAVGFLAFVTLAPLPSESDWQRLLGAMMIASHAPAQSPSAVDAARDDPSVL
jgi:hypothetical protein